MKVRFPPDLTERTIALLQRYSDAIEQGEEIAPLPLYPRQALLTTTIVEQVVQTIEGEFEHELVVAHEYHRGQNGLAYGDPTALVPPGFTHMSWGMKLALVQDLDILFQEYRIPDNEEALVPEEVGLYDGPCG